MVRARKGFYFLKTNMFLKEKDDTTTRQRDDTTTRQCDDTETPDPVQTQIPSHTGIKYLVRAIPPSDHKTPLKGILDRSGVSSLEPPLKGFPNNPFTTKLRNPFTDIRFSEKCLFWKKKAPAGTHHSRPRLLSKITKSQKIDRNLSRFDRLGWNFVQMNDFLLIKPLEIMVFPNKPHRIKFQVVSVLFGDFTVFYSIFIIFYQYRPWADPQNDAT